MRTRGTLVTIVSLLIAHLAMLAASSMLKPINTLRKDLQLTFSSNLGADLPPELAMSQAVLGTFRGLAVNVLWQRATQLKEEGRYYEAMQLSNWIVGLQPRFPQVWEFNAWNMAYNISVATHTPEDRWMWVQAGIHLLRDRGIPQNPASVRLYQQLAWIYVHKVGDVSDDMNDYYKRQLALQWQAVLGDPPDDPNAMMARLEAIAASPATVESLIAARPALAPLVRGASDDALRELLESLLPPRQPPAGVQNLAPADRRALEQFCARRVISSVYRMDPVRMVALQRRYGPMDFRLPASHAIYWATLGVEEARKRMGDSSRDFDTLNTDRLVFQSLQQLAYRGRLVFDARTGYYSLLPNTAFVASYEEAFLDITRRMGADAKTLRAGYQNFMEWSLRLVWTYGDPAEASRIYARLRTEFGAQAPGRYTQPIDSFVQMDYRANLDTPDDARQFIAGRTYQAILEGLANGRPEVCNRLLEEAKGVHAWFVSTQAKTPEDMKRLGIQSFPAFVTDAFRSILSSPVQQVPTLLKARIWRSAPEAYRRDSEPALRKAFTEECESQGLDATTLFPPPSSR